MDLTFSDRLISSVESKKTHVCVGLDPRIENIPKYLIKECFDGFGSTINAVTELFFQYNKKIIDAVADYACAIKVQVAFYEQYGHLGIRCFENTIEYAKKKELIVIGDVKRNDIGSTVRAYSSGYLGCTNIGSNEISIYGVDSITVNPYLGSDGILPFVEDINKYSKGIFVLVRTSNQSAVELQDLKTGVKGKKIFEKVGELVNKWGQGTTGNRSYTSVGAVVGATYPEEAKSLRKLMPNTYFLVPGYGAQGATASDIAPFFNADGLGALVNSSRDIIFAYQKHPWKSKYTEKQFDFAAKAATVFMRDEINKSLKKAGKYSFSLG